MACLDRSVHRLVPILIVSRWGWSQVNGIEIEELFVTHEMAVIPLEEVLISGAIILYICI